MDNPTAFRIVFAGRLRDGYEPDDVKRFLASQLQLRPEKIDAFFSGEKQVLKRTQNAEKAQRYVDLFARGGLVTKAEPEWGTSAAKSAPPAARPLRPLKPWGISALYRPALWLVAVFEIGTVLAWLTVTLGLLITLLHPQLLNIWLFEQVPSVPLAAMAYAVSLVLGLVVILLLVKPLLALYRPRQPTVPLPREQQPDMYAFVEDVCETVNVPSPGELHLSNDATLEVNYASDPRAGLVRGETVLTLGLPLLASLNVRQLAAAVAQAMHGWGPGEAPRAAWLINGIVTWMETAHAGTDPIDLWLAQQRERKTRNAALARHLERLITLSRLPLRMNLWFSGLLAGRLFQRRVTLADACARRLAGNQDFRRTLEQSRLLAYAAGKTLPNLRHMWHDRGELPDNLAMAVVAQASLLPPNTHEKLRQRQERQGVQVLHPTDAQRLAWLDQQQEDGSYRCKSSSALLFRRFAKLLHDVTMRYYHLHLKLPVTTNNLIRTPPKGSQEYLANNNIACFFGPLYTDFAPLGFDNRFSQMPADIADARQQWNLSLTMVDKERAKARTALTSLRQADSDLITVSNREVMHRADLGTALDRAKGILAKIRKEPTDDIYTLCRTYEAKYETALKDVGQAVTPYIGRLAATLALLTLPEVQARIENGARLNKEAEALVTRAGAPIERVYPQLRALRLHVLLLESLLTQYGPHTKRKLRDLITEKTDDVYRTLQSIDVGLRDVPFPFPTQQPYRNIMQWALRNALEGDGPAVALDHGADAVQNLALIQRLVLGRLCAIALQVEKAFGLKAPVL